jgi:hypothetical protein
MQKVGLTGRIATHHQYIAENGHRLWQKRKERSLACQKGLGALGYWAINWNSSKITSLSSTSLILIMAKGARASTKKANNAALKSKVFGPVEDARTQRLSAKLLELAQQPKKRDEVIMEASESMVHNSLWETRSNDE